MMEMDVTTDRKKQRRQLILFFFLSGILTATWSSRIPDVQQKLGLSNAALGSVLFVIPAGLVTGLTFASWAIASFSARRMIILSCFLLAVFVAIAGIASNTAMLVITVYSMGICRTLFNLSLNTAAVETQRLYERPIISTFHGLWSFACLIAAGISQLLIILNVVPDYHFPSIALLTMAIAFLFGGKAKTHQPSTEKRPFFVKPDKYLFLLGLICLCSMLCEGAMFDWSVNYFEKEVKADKSFVTIGYICFIGAMTIGRLIGDRLLHRFGIFRMIIICGTLMAIGFSVAAALPYLVPAALGFLLIGAGDSILVPVIYMLASRTKKMPPSYALSSVTLIGYAGFLVGPLLIGNTSQRLGMPVAFFILSALSLLIIFLSLKVKNTPA